MASRHIRAGMEYFLRAYLAQELQLNVTAHGSHCDAGAVAP